MASFDLNKKIEKPRKKITSKTVGIILLVICSIAFVALFTGLISFLRYFLLGVMGLFAYPFFLTLFVVALALINNKKYVLSKKYVLYISLAVISLLAIINLAILGKPNIGFFEYLGLSYSFQLTAGGILIGLLVAPFLYLLGLAGALVIFSISLIIFVALIVDYLHYVKRNAKSVLVETAKKREASEKEKPMKLEPVLEEVKIVPQDEAEEKEKEEFNVFLNAQVEENKAELLAKQKLGLVEGYDALEEEKKGEIKEKSIREHLLTPPKIDMSKYHHAEDYNIATKSEIKENVQELKKNEIFTTPNFTTPYSSKEEEIKPIIEENVAHAENILKSTISEEINSVEIQDNKKPEESEVHQSEIQPQEVKKPKHERNFVQFQIDGTEKKKQQELPRNVYRKPPSYIRPPLDLLDTVSVDLSTLNEDVVGKREKLENVLEEFNIPAKVIGVVVGPAVTRYELEMPPGITVKKVTAHADDIALALASKGGIRIEAPIPGKSAVGIEVPNEKIATVGLKEVINSKEFINNRNPLAFALGKDISGNMRLCNLAKMPHLLVAGATNSGKSVCLNCILISLLYKTSPEDLRFILIDPKRVEFSMYNGLPHLMLPNVITEADKALNAFNWAINEMERRFGLFQETRTRNLEEYNNLPDVISGEKKKLPMIIIMVDELADLIMCNKKEIEEKIMRLAQKARAAGIHLILATQRPSVDVITGTIKANFPSRIAFAVTSFQDSRTILDQGGAENLLGRGDMLYAPVDAAEPSRIQGAFVSGEEVYKVVEFVKDNNPSDFDEEVESKILTAHKAGGGIDDDEDGAGYDPLLPQALKMFIQNGQASISVIQRRFLVGYPRAARIVDQMEKANYISPQDGSKPRSVYLTMEQFEQIFGTNVG